MLHHNRVVVRAALVVMVVWCVGVIVAGEWWFLLGGAAALGMMAVLLSANDAWLIADGDDLTVKNGWRTHRLKRAQVSVISVRERRGISPGRIEVRLRDGTSVEVMVADPSGYGFSPGRDDLPDLELRLRRWLANA
ncbi:MAG: hypothetical protein RL238_2265 [Actinomycetota bacterium]